MIRGRIRSSTRPIVEVEPAAAQPEEIRRAAVARRVRLDGHVGDAGQLGADVLQPLGRAGRRRQTKVIPNVFTAPRLMMAGFVPGLFVGRFFELGFFNFDQVLV